MANVIERLVSDGLIKPPRWLPSNIHYLTIMGSVAYGVSTDVSDMDIYGFCIPPKEIVFPHLAGEIMGFGRQHTRFDQYQQHHVVDNSGNKEYDFAIYSIIRYFQLVMENNPNMIDSLFTPHRCVLHSTFVGNMVRENRRMFLHKKCWHTFKGYAYSQVKKMARNPEGKRKETVDKYGFDVKFAYHVVRLINEVEMILTEGDLDLERNREQLKAIRSGEWTKEQIEKYFETKERELESLYTTSKLPHGPDEDKIKALLLQCLEHHYGSLSSCVISESDAIIALREVRKTLDRYSHVMG